MDSDLSMQLVAARSAPTQAAMQNAMLKKSNEMDQMVVDMIAQSTQAPPPPGQGTRVDKLA
ncbi:hypothetical protein [Devosia sp.]|uniref:hypothetical protein n=1 Tax=Devosia sp. TaxID=1871048 RepID=UPI0032633770